MCIETFIYMQIFQALTFYALVLGDNQALLVEIYTWSLFWEWIYILHYIPKYVWLDIIIHS